MPPIEWLEHSTKAGHKLGMYIFALMLYRSNTSGDNDDIAQRLLRELEGADEVGLAALPWKNHTCTRCRKDVQWRLQDMCQCFKLPPMSKFLILRVWLGWCA